MLPFLGVFSFAIFMAAFIGIIVGLIIGIARKRWKTLKYSSIICGIALAAVVAIGIATDSGDSETTIASATPTKVARATAKPVVEQMTANQRRFETARKNLIASSDLANASPNLSNVRAACRASLKLAVAMRDMEESAHPRDQLIPATQWFADLGQATLAGATSCVLNGFITEAEFAEITK